LRKEASGSPNNLPESGRYSYQYDALSRLTHVAKDHSVLRTYEYDSFGNRTKKIEGSNKTSYRYNVLNQLVAMNDGSGDNYDYVYDERGNMSETFLNGRLTHKHHYGALNRLESVFNYEQGKGMLYDYNGLGHRIGKRIGLPEEPVTSETNFHDIILLTQTHMEDVIDVTRPHNNLLRRTNADVVDAQLNQYDEAYINFTWDFGVLSAQSEKETLHYLQDNLGSPLRLINDHGYERDVFNYDEFGNSLRKNHCNQPFSYTGYQICETSNTLFAQAREYNPSVGRFMSEDPIQAGRNWYTYCRNDPVNFIDPSGLSEVDIDVLVEYIVERQGGSLTYSVSSQRLPWWTMLITPSWGVPRYIDTTEVTITMNGITNTYIVGDSIRNVRFNESGNNQWIMSSSRLMEDFDLDIECAHHGQYDPFNSKETALLAWALLFHPFSGPTENFPRGSEHASLIYRDDYGMYMFGFPSSRRSAFSVRLPSPNRNLPYPIGANHTHPHDPLDFLGAGNRFSRGDGRVAVDEGFPVYLTAPNGSLLRLDPSWPYQEGNSIIFNNNPYVTILVDDIFGHQSR